MKMNSNRLWLCLILALIALVMATDQPAQAQGGGTLGYGSKVYATVSSDFPTVTYSFTGTPGDWINANVNNWTGTLNPQMDLVAPDGQILVRSTPDALNGDRLDAHLSAFLPQPGIYSLRITGHDGTTGDFLLALLGHSASVSTALVFGQPVDVTISENAAPQYFTFEALSCPVTLVIENPTAGQPYTYPFVAKVRDQRGEMVALLRGGEQSEDRITVAPNSGKYEVEITSADPTVAGSVRLLVTCSGDAPGCVAGQAGIAGIAGAVPMCTPCPGADHLIERGGCPAMHLSARQSETNPYEITVSWDEIPGADGYRVTVYGYGEAEGSTMYLTHSDWVPGNPLSFTWTLPPEGYIGFEFKLDLIEGGHAVCSERTTQFFEQPPDAICAPFEVHGTVLDPVTGALDFDWTPYPGATDYIYALFRIWPDGTMEYVSSGSRSADLEPSVIFTADPDQDWQLRVRPLGPGLPACVAEDTVHFGEEPSQQETCGDFHVEITADEGNSVSLAWPLFPGAESFNLSIWDASGALVPGTPVLMAADQTSITIDWLPPGTYTIGVGPWTTAQGTFCVSQVQVTIEVPAQQWTTCSIHLDSPRGGMANGLQDFYWSGPPDAVTYRLTIINNETGAVVLSTLIPAPVTSTTADISSEAIGYGFDFTVIIEALLVDGSVWCSDSVRQMREAPQGPGDQQVPPGQGSCYTLSTAVVNPCYDGATVSVGTGQNCPGGYLPGTVVNVQANRGDKCRFNSWSGCGASGNGNPTSITMNASCTITATFSIN